MSEQPLHRVELRRVLGCEQEEGLEGEHGGRQGGLPVDARVVHEEHDRPVVEAPLTADVPQELVDEVLEHRGVHPSLHELQGQRPLLTHPCQQAD